MRNRFFGLVLFMFGVVVLASAQVTISPVKPAGKKQHRNNPGLQSTTIASASAVTVLGLVSHITGTATISNFYDGKGAVLNNQVLYLIPDAAWKTNTGGNIATVITAVPGQMIVGIWDGSKWYLR